MGALAMLMQRTSFPADVFPDAALLDIAALATARVSGKVDKLYTIEFAETVLAALDARAGAAPGATGSAKAPVAALAIKEVAPQVTLQVSNV